MGARVCIGFMVVGCVVSESISAQNQKKERDGRTDGQTDKSKTISLRFAGDNEELVYHIVDYII